MPRITNVLAAALSLLLPVARPLLVGLTPAVVIEAELLSMQSAYAKSADDWVNSGNDKFESGDLQGAIVDYTKALEIDPQNAYTYSNRGLAKSNLRDYQGAITDYNRAIEINPKDADLLFNRGIMKNNSGDYQGAIADYNKAIQINPQDAKFYYNRGNTKKRSKDYRGAVYDYTKSLEINPQFAPAYSNLGIALFLGSNDYNNACSAFKKAASLGYEYRVNWLNSEEGAWCRNMQ